MVREIYKCRICGNTKLESILNLGTQYLTGVFPRTPDAEVSKGPLELVKCIESEESDCCGLLQLRHSYDLGEMYGEGYGYRSGINETMRNHLKEIATIALNRVDLMANDVILDVGSNDGTLLKNFADRKDLALVGIDPSAEKFRAYYPDNARLVVDFFDADKFRSVVGSRKAKIITSIAMFYDLEDPMTFVQNIHDILDDQGIWIAEQSYLLEMFDENTYDTICHEHLEYYGLRQFKWMVDKVGLKIVDVELNKINGGSFQVIVAKGGSQKFRESTRVKSLIEEELHRGFDTLTPYFAFRDQVFQHKKELKQLLAKIKSEGKSVIGYGASTKGNVLLQFLELTSKDIGVIADRNPSKHGCYTPGTGIAIISEEDARRMKPDYLLALPWHFRDEFVKREQDFLNAGGSILFPLPRISVVSKDR